MHGYPWLLVGFTCPRAILQVQRDGSFSTTATSREHQHAEAPHRERSHSSGVLPDHQHHADRHHALGTQRSHTSPGGWTPRGGRGAPEGEGRGASGGTRGGSSSDERHHHKQHRSPGRPPPLQPSFMSTTLRGQWGMSTQACRCAAGRAPPSILVQRACRAGRAVGRAELSAQVRCH